MYGISVVKVLSIADNLILRIALVYFILQWKDRSRTASYKERTPFLESLLGHTSHTTSKNWILKVVFSGVSGKTYISSLANPMNKSALFTTSLMIIWKALFGITFNLFRHIPLYIVLD